jgi:hypothetical protein
VHFASFLSGRFIAALLVNPSERKQAKRTSVHWFKAQNFSHCWYPHKSCKGMIIGFGGTILLFNICRSKT